jgi:hypothetical protein
MLEGGVSPQIQVLVRKMNNLVCKIVQVKVPSSRLWILYQQNLSFFKIKKT